MTYFNNKNNFLHGITFHHFHDEKKHLSGQGSINQKKFKEIIHYIGRKNILDPEIFINEIKNRRYNFKGVCLTFDDSLKCQYDIALPILQDYKIKAFFFVYSSALTNKPDLLEIYRYFRLNYFSSVDKFYSLFFEILENKKNLNLSDFLKKNKNLINIWKKKYQFYSINDIKFRLVRDLYLSKEMYKKIMKKMFQAKKFDYKKILKKIFLSKNNLKKLHNLGHKIGLHSHTHPTNIDLLSYKKQMFEYKKNQDFLKKTLNCKNLNSISHPCGKNNKYTFAVLNKLKVDIGFKQEMPINKKRNFSNFEIFREDHANIVKRI